MAHRFRHAIEHQPDAHARREQHCKPADIGEVRRCFLATKPHFPKRADNQRQTEDDKNIPRQHEEPVKALRHSREKIAEKRPGLFRQSQRIEHERDNRQSGNHENRVVNIKANPPKLPFDVVLADFVIGLNFFDRSFRLRYSLITPLVRHNVPLL